MVGPRVGWNRFPGRHVDLHLFSPLGFEESSVFFRHTFCSRSITSKTASPAAR